MMSTCCRICFLLFSFPVHGFIRSSSHPMSKTATAAVAHDDDDKLATNVVLQISYDGRQFTGFFGNITSTKRRKKNDPYIRSIQETMQSRLAKVYGNVDSRRIVVDSCYEDNDDDVQGVHATGCIVQIYCCLSESSNHVRPLNSTDTSEFVPIRKSIPNLMYVLNRMFPHDLRIMKYALSSMPFHPYLSCTTKTYTYTLSYGPLQDPTVWQTVWHIPSIPLNTTAKGVDDETLQQQVFFESLCHTGTQFVEQNVTSTGRISSKSCRIHSIHVEPAAMYNYPHWQNSTQTYEIVITGDKNLSPSIMQYIVGAMANATTAAPAQPIILRNVSYGDHSLQWKTATS